MLLALSARLERTSTHLLLLVLLVLLVLLLVVVVVVLLLLLQLPLLLLLTITSFFTQVQSEHQQLVLCAGQLRKSLRMCRREVFRA